MTTPLDGVRSASSVRAESSETTLTVVMGDDSPLPKKRPVTAPPSGSSSRQYYHIEVETEKHRPDCARGSHKPHQGECRHPDAVVAARASLIAKERMKLDYCEDSGDDVSRTTMPDEESAKRNATEAADKATSAVDKSGAEPGKATGGAAGSAPANKFTLNDPHVVVRPSRKGMRLNDPDDFFKSSSPPATREEVDTTPLLPVRRTSSTSPRSGTKKQLSFRSLTSAHSRYLRETLGEGESLGTLPSPSSRQALPLDSVCTPISAHIDCKSCDDEEYALQDDSRSEELNATSMTPNVPCKDPDAKHHATTLSFLAAVKGDSVFIGTPVSLQKDDAKPQSPDPSRTDDSAVKGDCRPDDGQALVTNVRELQRATSPKSRFIPTLSAGTSGDVMDVAAKLRKQDPCWVTAPMVLEAMERRRKEQRMEEEARAIAEAERSRRLQAKENRLAERNFSIRQQEEMRRRREEMERLYLEDPCWEKTPGVFPMPSFHEALSSKSHPIGLATRYDGTDDSSAHNGSETSVPTSSSNSPRGTPRRSRSRSPKKKMPWGNLQSKTEVVAWVPAPSLSPSERAAPPGEPRTMDRPRDKSRGEANRESNAVRGRNRQGTENEEEGGEEEERSGIAAGDETPPLSVNRGSSQGVRRNAICSPMPEAVFAAVVAAAASQSTTSNHSAGDVALSALWRQRNLPVREAWSRSAASVSVASPPSAPAITSFPSDSALRCATPLGSGRGASTVGREPASVPLIPQENPRINQDVALASKMGQPQRKSNKRLQREERARLLDKERRGTESSDDNDLILLEGEEPDPTSPSVMDAKLNHDQTLNPIVSEDSCTIKTDKSEPIDFDAQDLSPNVSESPPELSPQLSFMTRQLPQLQPPEISPRISPGSFPPRPHLRTPPESTEGAEGADRPLPAASSPSSSPSATLSPPSPLSAPEPESDSSPRVESKMICACRRGKQGKPPWVVLKHLNHPYRNYCREQPSLLVRAGTLIVMLQAARPQTKTK